MQNVTTRYIDIFVFEALNSLRLDNKTYSAKINTCRFENNSSSWGIVVAAFPVSRFLSSTTFCDDNFHCSLIR